MRRHLSKVTVFLAALFVGVMGVTGCMSRLPNDESVVAVFQGEKIYEDEAALYVYAMQYDTEKSNEYVISVLYGSYENFWNQTSQGMSFAENCRIDGIASLFQTRILNLKAKADGIELTEGEEAELKERIASFREEYADVISKAGASDALVEKFVRDNAVANKEYIALTDNVDQTLDEETFRRKTYEGLMIYGKNYNDDDEDKVEYSDEELKEAREQAMADLEAGLKDGKTINELSEYYIDDKIITVTPISQNVVDSSSEATGEFTSYLQLAWSLATGEVGTVVTKNSAGKDVGFVLRCINDDDPAERAKAEAQELITRRDSLFAKSYKNISAKYSDFVVREEAVAKFEIIGGLFKSEILNGATE